MLVFFCAVVMLLEPTSAATSSQTNSSAVSLSNGGSGRAATTPSEAASLNPAILAHLRGRDLHTSYFGDEWSVGISENSPDTAVPAALKFNRRKWMSGVSEYIESDLRLALGQFLAPKLAFGITAHQREYQLIDSSWQNVNMDVGIFAVVSPRLSLALIGYDLLPSGDNMPREIRPTGRGGVGVNFLFREHVRLRADYLSGSENNWGQGVAMVGYESFLNPWLVVRMGGRWDQEQDINLATAGFGFELPRFRLNYAYQTGITTGLEDVHSVDLGIPF